MKNTNDDTLIDNLKKVIEEYSGYKLQKILFEPDPLISETYAIRTYYNIKKPKEFFDWLIIRYNPNDTVEENSHRLEECEFKSWPPKSGNIRFF